MITEVKHLELNQFSVGSNFLRGGKGCCRKVGNMGCPFEIPFPLGPVHLVHHKGEKKKGQVGTFICQEEKILSKKGDLYSHVYGALAQRAAENTLFASRCLGSRLKPPVGPITPSGVKGLRGVYMS